VNALDHTLFLAGRRSETDTAVGMARSATATHWQNVKTPIGRERERQGFGVNKDVQRSAQYQLRISQRLNHTSGVSCGHKPPKGERAMKPLIGGGVLAPNFPELPYTGRGRTTWPPCGTQSGLVAREAATDAMVCRLPLCNAYRQSSALRLISRKPCHEEIQPHRFHCGGHSRLLYCKDGIIHHITPSVG
jgi:hypothetical protein